MITKITLDGPNHAVRAGFGKNNGRWFARVDLWWFGVRFTFN